MVGVLAHARERHLVRAPGALDLLAVDPLGAGPALGAAKHDHRPARPALVAVLARGALEPVDGVQGPVEHGREPLVSGLVIVRRVDVHPVGLPAVAEEERVELVGRDAGEHGRVGDLVAVQMQDRQHRAVGAGVQELVAVPAGRERAGLGLAVADHAGDHQAGVVEGRAERVREGVAELAALVDRAGCLGGDVARDPAGERELAEERLEACLVARDVRIDLGVGALEVGVCDQSRPAVPRPRDVDDVDLALDDRPVQVGVDEVQTRRGAEVAEQARLDVLGPQRLPQERICEQVDLPDGQVVGGPPVGVQQARLPRRTAVRRPCPRRSVCP